MHNSLFIGLMSGSSLDGIDLVCVDFAHGAQLLHSAHVPLPKILQMELLRLSQSNAELSLEAFAQLDTQLGQCFADAAVQFCVQQKILPEQIRAIGSHGQTVRHNPNGEFPYSLQLGDANIIAERTGITTVADFRRRDVAAGGQGAPLVPAFHKALFAASNKTRVVVNIGGTANITILHENGAVTGFDTGPGNGLMDAFCMQQWQIAFDKNGVKAAHGSIDAQLLQRLLSDPWLKLPAPKSTGRDVFHLDWLAQHLPETSLTPETILCTLNAFTANTIADAILANTQKASDIYVCGGGVHNAVLMQNLAERLPCTVQSTAALGVDPDYVEAMAFAWLAKQCMEGNPGNVVDVTGAAGPRILGAIYQA